MITKEQLQHGLEWISGKTKISVDKSSDYIDVKLYPNYPKQTKISLFLKIESDEKVQVIDLVGNGYNSGYQCGGYGRLIFNIGIQALYTYYGMPMNDPLAKKIHVYGEASSIGDPPEEPAKSECCDRRNKFWSDFGFELNDQKAFKTPMETTLADLKLRDGEVTKNGTQRIINLEKFWLNGEAPELLESDIQAFMSVDLEQFNLDECPTQKDLDTAYNVAEVHLKFLRIFIFLTLSALSVYWSFRLLETSDAFSYSIIGILFSYIIDRSFSYSIWRFLPAYQKYDRLFTQRVKMISGVKGYIVEVEQSYNGLLWRLYPGIKDFDESLSDNVFNDMAKTSKALNSFILADNRYKEYKHFMETAKRIILEREIKSY